MFGSFFGGQPDMTVQDPSMMGMAGGMGLPCYDMGMMQGQLSGVYAGGVGMPMGGMAPGMIGMQMPCGTIDCAGYVKYTRQQMLDGLRNYVIMNTQGRVPISRAEKIEETPQLLRHACAECGVSRLQMLVFNIPEAGVQIPFYFCTACGKLFYYKDFYC